MEHYLQDVNDAQREAVQATEGPVLVLAGAGAGKTRTIAYRILHLVRRGVSPERILAVTFTNKAAREMRERVRDLLANNEARGHARGGEAFGTPFEPRCATFHSFSATLLREQHHLLNLPKHFSIFDRSDSIRLIKRSLDTLGFDPKQWEPRAILSTISRAKGDGETPESFAERARGNPYKRIATEVWQEYDRLLGDEKALDFDDLLYKTAHLLRTHPDVRKDYQNRFDYVHIDEYQDTNAIQSEIADLIAERHRNIFVVGDQDQLIYSWRGASVETVFSFEKSYPEAKTILLEENYRSTKTIVHVSNKIIEKNVRRKKKILRTSNDDGEKIKFIRAIDEADEARKVAGEARLLITGGVPAGEIAVLYRANFQSRAIEEAFLHSRLPYQVVGTRFFERKEVKDVLSYLRAALNRDSLSDVARVINTPARGIGKVTLAKVLAKKEHELPAAARIKVNDFWQLLNDIAEAARIKNPSATVQHIVDRAGFTDLYRRGTDEDQERLENIKELASLAARYDALGPEEGIAKFLEEAALAADQDEITEEGQAVRLMTVHAAKGLEFSYVFITGLEEGLFPHERMDAEADDEEERRLFYVALTRAKKKLFLSGAASRMIFGSRRWSVPSAFLEDIDEEFIESDEDSESPPGKVVYLDLDDL